MTQLGDLSKLQTPLEMPIPKLNSRVNTMVSDEAMVPMISSVRDASKMMRSVAMIG